MVRTSILNDALTTIRNAEVAGKRQCMIRPQSKTIIKFLTVMQKHGYIGEFEIVDDHRSGKIVVELTGRINKCGVISPRFDVQVTEIEKWINNLLPSRQFGYLVLTTSKGIMDHEQARKEHTGGKVGLFILATCCCAFMTQFLYSCMISNSFIFFVYHNRSLVSSIKFANKCFSGISDTF